MEIGDRLNYLRENHLKISQEEFGKKIGVSRFSISNYESGKRKLQSVSLLIFVENLM